MGEWRRFWIFALCYLWAIVIAFIAGWFTGEIDISTALAVVALWVAVRRDS